MFRVVIFSSGSQSAIARLTQRIQNEVPGARVCGVLLERRPGKPLGKRISAFAKNIRQRDFLKYAARRLWVGAGAKAAQAGTAALQFIHAGKPDHLASEQSLDDLCPTFITT